METDTKELENLAILADSLGVPSDQLERFTTHGYVPLPWQLKFHAAARLADNSNGAVRIGAGGARGPGKSHTVFSQLCLDDCQRVPQLKALFLRQTGKAAQESMEDLVSRVLTGKIKYNYQPSRGRVSFANGSKVIMGGFETEKDIDKYIGIEYDVIAIEELNQITENKVTKLLGSMRTSKTNWRPRLYASFNPGGIGHQFVKEWFVTPFREVKERDSRFIGSTYKDNPFLNKEYIEYLEGLKGALGKAWREGNWDTFEGQYFSEWNYDKHVVHPFPIPASWKKFRAYDHGRTKPACCKWYALDTDGRMWVYRELYVTGLNADQIAKEIVKLSGNEEYQYSVADPAIFAKMGYVDAFGGETIAETFAHFGVTFIPASNRRVDGWNVMHEYLYWDDAHLPKMMYFKNCLNSIRTIPIQIHDELHPEDLDTDMEDHAVDADRYILATIHDRREKKPMNEIEKKLHALRQSHAVPTNLNDFYSGEYYRRAKINE